MLLLILLSNQSHSEVVQRWQDANGQWHFGDAAASHDRASQPVPIHNPISVVQNEHPTPTITTPTRSTSSKPKKTHSKRNPTPSCENMREQVYQQRTRDRAKLLKRYEKQCITAHYYGN